MFLQCIFKRKRILVLKCIINIKWRLIKKSTFFFFFVLFVGCIMFKISLILLYIIGLYFFEFWMIGNNLAWSDTTCIIKWLLIIDMILHSRWWFLFMHLCTDCLINSLFECIFFIAFFLFNLLLFFFSQSYHIFKNLHFFKWFFIHIKFEMTLPSSFFFLLSFLNLQQFRLILEYVWL